MVTFAWSALLRPELLLLADIRDVYGEQREESDKMMFLEFSKK